MSTPEHYQGQQFDVLDFIEDQNLGFVEGNIVKYLCRYKKKSAPLPDLKKAAHYLELLIKREERCKENTNIESEIEGQVWASSATNAEPNCDPKTIHMST